MLLTPEEFDAKLSNDNLHLALVGMSNIGKSYTAQRLANAADFTCYDVDAQIQARMNNPSMAAMAKWMGHPYEEGYASRAAEYLTLEAEESLAGNHRKGNQVLDTTGSVIHLDRTTLKFIKNNYLIIYIHAVQADIDVLIDRYFEHPKPTIWGEHFRHISGKTDKEALIACYPALLEVRAKLYADMADITIPAAAIADTKLQDADILPLIRNYLPDR